MTQIQFYQECFPGFSHLHQHHASLATLPRTQVLLTEPLTALLTVDLPPLCCEQLEGKDGISVTSISWTPSKESAMWECVLSEGRLAGPNISRMNGNRM